uniref:Uncharacterized protein n=1 Tax=Anguilla anguilla TaxID=7936 RepID=A0A0E9SR65_ANGAN
MLCCVTTLSFHSGRPVPDSKYVKTTNSHQNVHAFLALST